MKIYNIQTNKTLNYQQKTSFKGAKISPVALKKLEQVKNNPKTNDIFIKLASVLGLTAILGWVKSLTEKNNNEELNKLDIIDTAWTNKNNSLLLGQDTKEQYLDILSKADETESILWTKALLSKEDSSTKNNITAPNNDSTELFLSKDSNETFMTISANKAINSILMQIKALEGADDTTRENFVKEIENKLNGLIKQADSLQNDVKSSELYSKLANITKIFAMYNAINSNDENKVEKLQETVSEKIEDNIDELIDSPKETNPKVITEIKTVTPATPVELPVTVPEKIEIPEDMKPAVKVVAKIDLKDDGKSRFKPSASASITTKTPQTMGEIVVTEKNKEFVEEVFKKAFKRTSEIKPETYCGHIDLIQKIYDSYSDEKDKLKKNFLSRLSETDMRHTLNNYLDFTNGKDSKLDFMTFLKLDEFKKANGGELTKKEFELINNSKDVTIKYFQYYDDKIRVVFNPGVSAEKRLEFIKDLHKIVYNVDSTQLFKGSNVKEFAPNDIIHELSYRLAKDSTQYPNITRFLNIALDELPETEGSLKDENDDEEKTFIDYSENFEDIKEILNKAKYRTRISELSDAINNPAFDGLMDSTHARMRFIERYVFGSDSRLLSKNAYEVKIKTSKKIESLKQNIEDADAISFINYPTKDMTKSNQKFGPRIFVKGFTIGLNDKAQIHTIWDS